MNTSAAASRTRSRRAIARVAAIVLALVGVVVLTVAACSSQSGPPQPSVAAAGTIDPTTSALSSSTSSEAPSVVSSEPAPSPETSAAATTAPATTAEPVGTPVLPTINGPILAASKPTLLSIPAIGVTSSPLLDLGQNADGTIEVPSLDDPDSKAGWFDRSNTPGTQGPAILLGHIDSRKYGPGVFYNLGNLNPGDSVEITREDGSVAVFAIDAVRVYDKDNFPTLEVYQNIDHAGLRLITCGGTFDPAAHSYESNIVAFASLVSSRAA